MTINGEQVELTNYKTLKLDATWRPVAIIPAVDALLMSMDDKCTILETWNREVRSQFLTLPLPSVIVLKNHRALPHANRCTKKNVIARDNHTCQYCGRSDCEMTIDHVIPRSKGGKFSWDNLVSACPDCNQRKGNRSLKEAKMKLLSIPQEPKGPFIKKQTIHDKTWSYYLENE
jgi:5-methylcytosine-specific restriction endonuclease McrA